MTRRNPPAKWVLPSVVDPPRSCVMIEVPNDIQHRAAFLGAILNLASAYKWQDDQAHTARDVALVWRDIYDNIKFCEPGPDVPGIVEMDYEMSICEQLRWNNGVLEGLCCGEWTAIEGQPAGGFFNTQPGGGTAQPEPGGCLTYHATLPGSGLWKLPTNVTTGDTIEVLNAAGATYNPTTGGWFCPDGSQFILGSCFPSSTTNAGNPMPAVKSGRIIALIGSTYYDVYGPVFTVPGGVTGQPVTFQINYDNLPQSAGSLTFDVEVCNNQAASWSHVVDLTATNFAFNYIDGGVWTGGTGWQTSFVVQVPNNGEQIYIAMSFGRAINLTGMSLKFDTTLGSHGGSRYQQFGYSDAGNVYHQLAIQGSPSNGTAQTLSWSGTQTVYGLQIIGVMDAVANPTAPDGVWTIYEMTISGTGFDPVLGA